MKQNGRPGKRIFCINDAKIYDSLTSAAQYYNIARTSISKQLMGIRPTAGGRYFIYIDNDISNDELKKIRKEMLEKIYNIENLD